MYQRFRLVSVSVVVYVLFLLSGCAMVQPDQVRLPEAGMVASAHPLATEAGLKVLADGGNAFDAAVTVAAVLAVVEPFGSGIGGGGFWLLHEQEKHRSVFVDSREAAPGRSSESMYVRDGQVDRERATNHPLAAGIPGTPAAFGHIQREYGSLPLARLLEPAIVLARDGFEVTSEYQDAVRARLEALQKWPTSSVFLQDGDVPQVGWRLVQTDLADTLSLMAQQGARAFYEQPFAGRLVDSVGANDGIWSLEDLESYKVIERDPIQFQYGEYTVTSAPLPSSGGLVLGSVFGQLTALDYERYDDQDKLHLWLEANRNAYHQRALRMGDADFTGDEALDLLLPRQAKAFVAGVSATEAGSSAELEAVDSGVNGDQTTHFSILDGDGNRASVTLSINLYFGSGFVAKGTGVLLNNEMDDFSAKPGEPNAYGLVGSHANKIEPGKRPLSSMSPTFLERNDGVWILGTPGGSRIITMVGRGLLAAMGGYSPREIVALGRVHHQYLPDKVFVEKRGLSEAQMNDLRKRGHEVVSTERAYGDMQVIYWDKSSGSVVGASDRRGEGMASSTKELVE